MRKLCFAAAMAAPLMLSACNGAVPPGAVSTAPADPAVVAKINYVCAYSGLFKFADTAASSVIPVPGVALATSLINEGVDNACLHPESVASDIAVVENLISQFKAAGKM